MTWYAAHIIMYAKFKEEHQQQYPVWENIFLLEAQSVDEAWEKATTIGKKEEGDSFGTFTWDGKPATWVFAGIRKLIECEYSSHQHALDNHRPGSGAEITYSQLEVDSEEALMKLAKGEPVIVLYEE